jgi:carbamoyl-phosphate synthase/aspartate carbamoyltransferase
MLLHKADLAESEAALDKDDWKSSFEQIDWVDPNVKNLVAEGKRLISDCTLLSNGNV